MGIVLAKIPAESFEEVIPTAGYRGRGFSSGQGERKYLYRRANSEERVLLAHKVADEEKALQVLLIHVVQIMYYPIFNFRLLFFRLFVKNQMKDHYR